MALVAKDSPISLWRQLKSILHRMATGEFRPGDRLPSEQELCLRFGVSRITVRQAVASLVDEGILVTQQGKGTFVALPKYPVPLVEDTTPWDWLGTNGVSQATQLLGFETVPADARLASKLRCPEEAPILRLRRLRTVDDIPVSYKVTFVPEHLCHGLSSQDLIPTLSRLMEEAYGLKPASIDETVEWGPADRLRASVLGVSVGTPLIVAEHVRVLPTGVPMRFDRAYYLADRFKLVRTIQVPHPRNSEPRIAD